MVAVARTLDRYQQFGEWLRGTRDAIGITQKELSLKMGRPHSFIGKVETAQRRLDIIEFEQLAEALGVSPLKLYERFFRARP
jgi:transcriptional regulator with XRE-family HTH domain